MNVSYEKKFKTIPLKKYQFRMTLVILNSKPTKLYTYSKPGIRLKTDLLLSNVEMTINFNNLTEDVIPMNQFRLKHRFTNDSYEKLPDSHLEQLKPLGKKGANFLWDYTLKSNLHGNTPFKKDFFRTIEKASISEGREKEIKLWLFQRGIPFEKPVFLSWQPTEAMIVPWKLLIKYFDHFHNCTCGDLTVVDQSLNWALLFHHQDEIFFGSNSEVKIIEMNQEFLIA